MEVHARRKSSFVIIVKYFYHDRFSYVYERFIFRVVYSIAPVVGRSIRYNFILHFLYCLPSKLALDASQHCSYKALFGDSVKKCDNGKFVTCFSRFEYDVNFLSKKFRCTRSNSRTSSHGGLSFVLYFLGWTFKSN